MTGLLIVSHSAKIADGTLELAEQMTRGEVPIAAAGGTDDGSPGTSADLIRAAERLVARGAESLLVLVDLGSALMAAVEASIGANLKQVAAVAEQTKDLLKVHA